MHYPGVQPDLMNSVIFAQVLGLQTAGHTYQIHPGLFLGGSVKSSVLEKEFRLSILS